MRKIIPILIISLLIFSGLGAGAINYNNEMQNRNEDEKLLSNAREYTHTVFVEVGTATWCPSCPASNTAWHNIYESGDYNFEYTEMVIDKNYKADSRMNNDYNLYWVPTSYFDGGQFVYPGTNIGLFKINLNNCGERLVPDLDAEVSAQWLGDAKIQIDISIKNNDNNDYDGTLRVYIIELKSTLWNDYNGNPYYHAFLDFPWNQVISIDSDDIFEDSKLWDGVAAGFGNIQPENLQVILAIFNDVPIQAYSDPFHQGDDPTWAPFLAYYVDETVAVEFHPPNKPTITGPKTVDPNVENQFTFNTVDEDGDDVYYWIDWGDNSNSDWIGPYLSGSNSVIGHIYENIGIYNITVKAKDISDIESDWSDPHKVIVGNLAPNKPTINGPTTGIIKTDIEYTFVATDPNEDDLFYTIKWGDGSSEDWIGPYNSDQEVKVSHSWKKEGTWYIQAKVKDIADVESDWTTLKISVPRTRQSFNELFKLILNHFPIMIKIIENLSY